MHLSQKAGSNIKAVIDQAYYSTAPRREHHRTECTTTTTMSGHQAIRRTPGRTAPAPCPGCRPRGPSPCTARPAAAWRSKTCPTPTRRRSQQPRRRLRHQGTTCRGRRAHPPTFPRHCRPCTRCSRGRPILPAMWRKHDRGGRARVTRCEEAVCDGGGMAEGWLLFLCVGTYVLAAKLEKVPLLLSFGQQGNLDQRVTCHTPLSAGIWGVPKLGNKWCFAFLSMGCCSYCSAASNSSEKNERTEKPLQYCCSFTLACTEDQAAAPLYKATDRNAYTLPLPLRLPKAGSLSGRPGVPPGRHKARE